MIQTSHVAAPARAERPDDRLRLARACEANMGRWYLRKVAGIGGRICRDHGLVWGHSTEPMSLPGTDRMVSFPRTAEAEADAAIGRMVMYFRAADLAPWCACGLATTPDYLRRDLKLYGFAYLFSEVCMAIHSVDAPALRARPAVDVRCLTEAEAATIQVHPSYGPMSDAKVRATMRSSLAMAARRPQRTWLLGAWRGSELVGHALLMLSHGVAGIYDVAVLPAFRRQNIGSTIVAAACRLAHRQGMQVSVLQNNANLIEFYNRIGFRVVPDAAIDVWAYSSAAAERDVPSAVERVAARANGLPLDEMAMSAVTTHRIDRLRALLDQAPMLALRNLEALGGGTLLHLATLHGVTEAVELLLAAGAEPEAKDQRYGAPPLDWGLHGLGPNGPLVKTDQLGCARLLLAAGAKLTPELREGFVRVAGPDALQLAGYGAIPEQRQDD